MGLCWHNTSTLFEEPAIKMRKSLLSIVISTYNRAHMLDQALKSLAEQTAQGQFEIVVVDNNSTDETAVVVQKWIDNSCMRLVRVLEPKQGLSYARNCGIAHAHGEFIAFIDDDVRVTPQWVESVIEILLRMPDIDCLTGPVDPLWESGVAPDWLNNELLCSIGVGNYGDNPKILKGKEYPIGANMIFRRSTFSRIGQFDPRLGRIGINLLSCEEVEFIDRLRRKGGKIFYHPAVRVKHFVQAARTTKQYVLSRRQWDGRSFAIWEQIRGGKRLLLQNALLRVLFVIPRDAVGWALSTLISDQHQRFVYTCRLAKTVAYLDQVQRNLFCSG